MKYSKKVETVISICKMVRFVSCSLPYRIKVEAVRQMVPASGEVERRAQGNDAGDLLRRGSAPFAGPFEQRIAAKRNAGGMELTAPVGGLQTAQDPVDFVGVAGVIGPRPPVHLSRAAAKVRQGQSPARFFAGVRGGERVVALGAAFKSVEEDEQW